jgi:hypothetical protein
MPPGAQPNPINHYQRNPIMINSSSFGILLFSAALAATAPAAATTGTAEKNEGAVAYLASGKSKEDTAAMRHVARYYPLELEFVRRTATRLQQPADIDVMIKGRNGKLMLRAKAGGDLLLADLPAGEYAVSATYNGVAILQNVSVEMGQHRKHNFEWKN